jgi:Zn-finger nucleic acid-binding protein
MRSRLVDVQCPRCPADTPPLAEGFGVLTEDVCGSCKGRFLPPLVVERIVVDELGVSQDVLRELTALFASKERIACPSCESKMSPVHIKKVRVDLCTGCGGAWLDAGELAALSQGRHEELTPSSVAVAPLQATAAAPMARDDDDTAHATSGVIVFFDDPAHVNRDALAAAFAQLPGLSNADAMQIVAKQRTTVVEGASEAQAQAVVAALAAQGIASHIADASWLSLPPPYQTNALSVDAEGITLGRADANVGRVVVPWPQVSAIVAAQIVRSAIKRLPSHRPAQANDNKDYELSVVEAADTCVDIVLTGPPRRYRLLLSTFIFGEAGKPRAQLARERLTALVQAAPSTLGVGRGVRAAVEGAPLPRLSMRDLERELGWLLWRAFGTH